MITTPGSATPAAVARAEEVVAFWLQAGPKRWFSRDEAFDDDFRERFLGLHFAAARRELDDWADAYGARAAVALVLLLDQFPRNAFRHTAHMFATDALARRAADRLLAAGHDLAVDAPLRLFCLLPFMHSEALADQRRSVELHRRLGDEPLRQALHHQGIVQRFGRFPHRNRLLGRDSSAEEQAFLEGGGFRG